MQMHVFAQNRHFANIRAFWRRYEHGLPDAFRHIVPNDNLDWQTPLKNTKFYLFGSKKMPIRGEFSYEES